MDRCTFKWPDARREVETSADKYRTATHRPYGYEPLASDRQAIRGCGIHLPHKFPALSIQAIKLAVIRSGIDEIPGGHGSKANRPVGEESP